MCSRLRMGPPVTVPDSARLGPLLLVRALRLGSAAPALGSMAMDSPLPALDAVRSEAFSLFRSHARMGPATPVLCKATLGSSLPPKTFACPELSLPLPGRVWFDLPLPAPDVSTFGTLLSLQSVGRLGFATLVMDLLHSGSPSPVRSFAQSGSSASLLSGKGVASSLPLQASCCLDSLLLACGKATAGLLPLLLDFAILGSPMSARSVLCLSSSVLVVKATFGPAVLLQAPARVDSFLLSFGAAQPEPPSFAPCFSNLGSPFFPRSSAHLGSSSSTCAAVRLGAPLPPLDRCLGPSAPLRGPGRLGSAAPASNPASCGAPPLPRTSGHLEPTFLAPSCARPGVLPSVAASGHLGPVLLPHSFACLGLLLLCLVAGRLELPLPLSDSQVLGVLMLARSFACVGVAAPVSSFCSPEAFLSLKQFACVEPPLVLWSCGHLGPLSSIVDYLHPGPSLSLRSLRLGSRSPVSGLARFGLSTPPADSSDFGSTALLRAAARLGPPSLALAAARVGASPPAPHAARPGSASPTRGSARLEPAPSAVGAARPGPPVLLVESKHLGSLVPVKSSSRCPGMLRIA